MRRKSLFVSLAAGLTILLSTVAVSAQTGQLRGEVTMTGADGKSVPAAGVTVDIYRTDLPGHYPTKTDKKGAFSHAGIPFVGTYILVASAPNARADIQGNVKAGRDITYKLILVPGDGKRPTQEEAKAIFSAGSSAAKGGGSESAEDRKKREELIAKNAEIEAGNKKIEASNVTVSRTFKEGNAAMTAKKYDEAIALYDEGINADPEHPGTPALLTNKSVALRARAVEGYNVAIVSKDEALQKAGLEKARKDFRDAADAATKAVELVKKLPAPTEGPAVSNHEANKYFALAARAEAMRLFVGKVDPSQVEAGVQAYQEYMAAEKAVEKKTKAQVDLAQMLLDAGAGDKAYAEFQVALTQDPNNVDAILGSGLSLFATGDKAKYQEAANFLQLFVDKAPDTHKFKADAKAVLENLKAQDVKPQKTTTTGGRRRG